MITFLQDIFLGIIIHLFILQIELFIKLVALNQCGGLYCIAFADYLPYDLTECLLENLKKYNDLSKCIFIMRVESINKQTNILRIRLNGTRTWKNRVISCFCDFNILTS